MHSVFCYFARLFQWRSSGYTRSVRTQALSADTGKGKLEGQFEVATIDVGVSMDGATVPVEFFVIPNA